MLWDLTDEQRMLREAGHAFAREDVAPLAREIDREQRLPAESWTRAAELGILGMAAPPEYGGTALGLTEMSRVRGLTCGPRIRSRRRRAHGGCGARRLLWSRVVTVEGELTDRTAVRAMALKD